MRNLSILDHREESRLLDQVKLPPRRGISIRLCSKIESENSSSTVGEELAPNFSLGKWVTLKLPPMHQRICHHVIKLANSFYSDRRSTFEFIETSESPLKLVVNTSKFNATKKLTTHISIFSTTLLSHNRKMAPEAPLESN